MTARTVTIGLASYVDPDGVRRIGLAGETVQVHADHVKRFDELNGAPPKDTPAPKRRARPRKT